jgi:hypothetical protein
VVWSLAARSAWSVNSDDSAKRGREDGFCLHEGVHAESDMHVNDKTCATIRIYPMEDKYETNRKLYRAVRLSTFLEELHGSVPEKQDVRCREVITFG